MTSNYMPDVKVEIAFDSGYSTPTASRTWTDVSSYVELKQGINITYGRGDEFTTAEPNHLALTLDNSDGRFTAGKTGGAYYPNVKIGRPIKVTATPVGGSASVRFLGYVEEWPVSWDGTDATAYAQITALSRMARLGLDVELRSVVSEQILSTSPYAYYPLNEAAGSAQAADATGGLPLVASSAGDVPLIFGGPTFLPGDPGTGVGLSASSSGVTQGLYVDFATPLPSAYPFSVSLEAFITDSGGALNGFGNNITTMSGASGLGLSLNYSPGGFSCAYTGGATVILSSVGVIRAAPIHLAGELIRTSATNVTLNFYINGVLAATGSNTGATAPDFTRLSVGSSYNDAAVISHVTLARDATGVADRATSGLTGFAGESAGDRIKRLASFVGVLSTEVDGGTATEPTVPIDTTGITALDVMRKVEAAEFGVLHDSRSNVLTLNSRVSRYLTTSAFTLSAALQEIEADITPKLDRSTLVNDITATAFDGTTSRVTDATSIAAYGSARQPLDVSATEEDAGSQAAWKVARFAEPLPRIPALGVDLLPLSLTKQTAVIAAHIGTRFTAAGLPAQAPASSIDFFVEGYTETIGPETYRFVFNVSPIDALGDSKFWILGDATYGAYDTTALAY